MKEFVEYLLHQFVSKPEEVMISESMDGDTHILSVKVAQEDIGLVIGKEGKTINSIRNLAKAKAIRENIFVRIVLDEGDNPKKEA